MGTTDDEFKRCINIPGYEGITYVGEIQKADDELDITFEDEKSA